MQFTNPTAIVPLPVHGPAEARRFKVYRTTFLEDGIHDGEYGEDAFTESELIVVEPDQWDDDDVTALDKAVSVLVDLGVTEPSSSHPMAGDWFSDPDGSYISNYGTGERVETSAHPYGFTDDELGELFTRVRSGRGY